MSIVYQNRKKSVKGSIELLDAERLKKIAGDGLLALSVELGLEVVRQLFEEEATELAGPKGRHQKNRQVYRHGTESTQVVMGGGKIQTEKPRLRSVDNTEVPLRTLALFQQEDELDHAVLSRLLAGVSTRKYSTTVDGISRNTAKCLSKSEVSRRFGQEVEKLMDEFFSRRIESSYHTVFVDGTQIGDLTVIVVMGIDDQGRKHILGLAEGATENSTVVNRLFEDLIERGLPAEEPRLFVLDGSKALHKAVKDTFGDSACIQRCQVHKKRNVLSYLPASEQGNISIALTNAYREFDYNKAKDALEKVAGRLEFQYPKAAESLREGMEETLTVHRLKVAGILRQTLSNTNALESANSVCKGVIKRVTRFRNGADTIRHAAAGFMEVEKGLRRVKGYRQIPLLKAELAKHLGRHSSVQSMSA
jgi:transposase-like protein